MGNQAISNTNTTISPTAFFHTSSISTRYSTSQPSIPSSRCLLLPLPPPAPSMSPTTSPSPWLLSTTSSTTSTLIALRRPCRRTRKSCTNTPSASLTLLQTLPADELA